MGQKIIVFEHGSKSSGPPNLILDDQKGLGSSQLGWPGDKASGSTLYSSQLSQELTVIECRFLKYGMIETNDTEGAGDKTSGIMLCFVTEQI